MVRHCISLSVFLIITLVITKLSWTVSGVPYQFYECAQPSDCKPGECCVVGMMRYSVPTCQPLVKEGEYCLGSNVAKNMTLYYPNGASVDLMGIYTLFCPCEPSGGLTCQRGMCQKYVDYDVGNVL